MKKYFNRSEDRQRFSLRKLTVGVASVLLGTTFMVFGTRTVHADDINSQDQVKVENVQKNNISSNVDKSTVVKTDNKEVENQITASKEAVGETAKVESNQNVAAKVSTESTPQSKDIKVQDSNLQKSVVKDAAELDKTVVNSTLSENGQDKVENSTSQNNSSNEKTADTNSKKDVNEDPENAPITRQDVESLFGLDSKKDISKEALDKLGLKSDEFYLDGIIYHVKGNAVVREILDTDENGNPTKYGEAYTFKDIPVFHNTDGTVHDSNNGVDDTMQIIYNVSGNIDYKYLPIVDGGTIFVNKGDELTEADAKRGMVDNNKYNDLEHADSYTWDNRKDYKVDTNKTGIQNGMVDVGFKIGNNPVKISVGVEVTIVDLKGQPIVTHINADTPDPAAGITGQPAGTTNIHWTQVPSTKTPGSTQGVVEVTYPDGTKGTATVPVTVLAPNVPKIIYVPKTDPAPDPSTVVTNNPEIQKGQPGTAYTWERTPDPSTGGHIPTVVVTHWPDGKTTDSSTTIVVTEEITENHKVVRTIIENLPNQDPKTIEQSVTFSRTNTVDSADHSKIIKAGTWKADGPAAWGVFTPDQVKGYTADPAQVPAMAVTPDTPNAKVVINYKANNPGTPDTPVTPPVDPGDNPTPVTPPVKPEQKPITPTPDNNDDTPAPTPHATKTPAKDNGGKKTSAKGRGEQTKNSGLGNGENANNGRVTVRPLATAKPASPTMKKTVNSEQKATLPQTGKKDNVALTAIGVAIAAAGSLLGLADSKKRRS